jgi:transposase-like protein
MEYLEAQKIKAEWGDKPCDHPHLEKEYYSGAFLTNYVCTTCGREFTIPQKMEMYEKRRKKAHPGS